MAAPNILIFMTDQQRGDTVLPEHPAVTPNLATFAEQGVTFTEAFCPAPHCSPSRGTLHSGLYPTRCGVWNNVCNDQALTRGPKQGVRLCSEDLADAGYRMLFSGKWHVSVEESPRDKGWQELCVGGHRAGGPTWDLYRDLAAQSEPTDRRDGEILRPGYPPYRLYGAGSETSFIKQDETALGHALDALPQLAKGNDPWVLFVGVVGPHDPYIVPKEFIDLYSLDDVPLPPTFGDDMADKPRIYQRLRQQIWGQLTEREVRDAIRHYWAYCSYLDDMFGKLLRALDETGAAENTLVAYCSDHGDYCGDHGLFCKGIPCFRGAYHVPAVLRWPAGIENPGRRVDGFVSLADFAPTFIELAALEVDRDFSGASLAPFLRGDTPTDWRDEIHAQCNGVELYYTQRWVMTKQFKYVFNGFDFDELYDLHADPDEMTNLSEQSAYAEIKRDLVRRMWRFACRENDTVINDYITVGLTPYGPAEAFREGMP